MTTERFTQCPHCKASFKVSGDQLEVANGRVRCGACMNIFDAIAYSISNSNQDDAPAEDQDTPESPPVDLEASLLAEVESEYGPDEEGMLFQDNPDEDRKESNYSGSGSISDELSTSFQALDEEDDQKDPYIGELDEEDDAAFDATDESWTTEVLEDAAAEETKPIEPSMLDRASENNQSSPYFDSQLSTSDKSNKTKNRNEQDSYESLAYFQRESRPAKSRWLITSLVTLVNIMLLGALLAQASWFHYEKFAKYPQVAGLFEQACLLLKCELPKLADISMINNNNLVVRSHPTTRKALIIDTVIINDATFPQAFPDIALYFSDINSRTIAQRLIKPQEYLSGDLLKLEEMPAEQPIHIAMEILDPGNEAVNYSLKFFPAQITATN